MKRQDFANKRKEFAEKTIDELIDLLSDKTLMNRFFAEMCLRDATSTWLNFKPASSQEEREKAIKEWREWLMEREGKFKKRLKRKS